MNKPRRWECTVCGYIHEGPEPPEVCPICGVGPELFEPYGEPEPTADSDAAGAWRCTVCDEVITGDSPPDECPVCGAAAHLFEPTRAATQKSSELTGHRIVILGGGIAGFTAADHARRMASNAVITLVHKETDLPYNRLNLTRFLAGEVAEEKLSLRERSWFADQQIALVQGEATQIDRKAHVVELRAGEPIPYDQLVLTTGAHSFVPPILGVTRDGVFTLRTKKDGLKILERAKKGANCVCLGGGLLGLEVAYALSMRGAKVTVLEGFTSLLPRQLAEPAGKMLESHLATKGLEVRCSVRVEEILGDENVRAVRLVDDEEIPADMVVLATGIRPNSHLARQAGLEVGNGVIVDDQLRTSDVDILAAGDVAEHRGVVYGLWPVALSQGAVAGANAAGARQEVAPFSPGNQLKVLDVLLFSIGQFQPTDASFHVVEREEGGTYVRLVVRDGCLVGANLYGDLSLSGVVKSAIEEKTPLVNLKHLTEQFPDLI